MSSSESNLIAILTTIPIHLHRYAVPLLYVLGNLGNAISIAIFSKKSWRKNVCTFYFVVCLLCNTAFINSTMLGSIAITGFNIHAHNYSPMLCKVFYYCSYLFSTYYPIILILASIDRLLISSQKVDTRLYSSKRLAYFSIGTSSILWSIFSLHVLIKVSIQEMYPSVSICYYELSKSYLDFFLYSVLILSICIPVLMVVLSVIAFKNVRHIRAVPRQERRERRSMTKKDFQLLRCLYAHSLVFVLFSFLIDFSVVYSTAVRYQNRTPMERAIDSFLGDFGGFLHYFPFCTSFMIFVAMSKAFRFELKRWTHRLCGRELATVQEPGEEEINQQQLTTRELTEIPHIVVHSVVLSA